MKDVCVRFLFVHVMFRPFMYVYECRDRLLIDLKAASNNPAITHSNHRHTNKAYDILRLLLHWNPIQRLCMTDFAYTYPCTRESMKTTMSSTIVYLVCVCSLLRSISHLRIAERLHCLPFTLFPHFAFFCFEHTKTFSSTSFFVALFY